MTNLKIMKSKLLLFVILALLLVNTAFSQEEQNKTFNTINERAVEVPYNQNASVQLPMLSKTYINIHEGSRLDFNVVDPDNFRILIRNSMIINKIENNTITILLSSDSSGYEEVMFNLGRDYIINYTYEFVPKIIITPIMARNRGGPEERFVMLYFLVNSIKTRVTDFSDVKPISLDFDKVTPYNPQAGEKIPEERKIEKVFNFILITAIIVLALYLIAYFISRKPKHR